jgi:hypothetical protein
MGNASRVLVLPGRDERKDMRSQQDSRKQEEEGRERTHHVSSDVTLSASEEVVHLASGVVVWQLPPGVDRKENAGREII